MKSYINHGTLLDVYDYKALIEAQANEFNSELTETYEAKTYEAYKVVSSREYNQVNISKGYTLNRKMGR